MDHPYPELPGFEHVYLEDSFVTAIIEEPLQLSFKLDVVLIESHPLYQPPPTGEQYCYRLGSLEFPDVQQVTWNERHIQPYRDAAGQIDYGNIDVFCWSNNIHHLEGDWGNVDVTSGQPILYIMDGDQSHALLQ